MSMLGCTIALTKPFWHKRKQFCLLCETVFLNTKLLAKYIALSGGVSYVHRDRTDFWEEKPVLGKILEPVSCFSGFSWNFISAVGNTSGFVAEFSNNEMFLFHTSQGAKSLLKLLAEISGLSLCCSR